MGALPFRDGLSATGFPSGVRGGPIEIFESMSTMIIWRKEYRQDFGGAGAMRGGLGQAIEMENGIDEPFYFNCAFERIKFAPRGFDGGLDGAAGYVGLRSGGKLPGKGRHLIPVGERVLIMSPGGGGIGAPGERDPARIEADLRNGLISSQAADQIYGLKIVRADASRAEPAPEFQDG